MKQLDSTLPINDPFTCENKTHEVYKLDAYDESQSCDNLYFRKQVFYWGSYKIDGQSGDCEYSTPSSSGDFKTEKFIRNSILFTDKLSRENPAQGIKVKREISDTYQNMWSSTLDVVEIPWQLDTGFMVKNEWFGIKFGDPDRSALIWGIQFMRQQLETVSGSPFTSIAYKYHKDVARGSYGNTDWRSPETLTDDKMAYSISMSDVDENGLHYFKDGSGNPIIFTASEIFIRFSFDGYFNFDLLGSIYDFQKASTGADTWTTHKIGQFWVKGTLLYFFL